MASAVLDFKKQRPRWACGAMQILRRHCNLLIRGRGGNVTAGQRYHFIAGSRHIEPPLAIFSVLPLSLFAFKLVKLVHLYRTRVGANRRRRSHRHRRALPVAATEPVESIPYAAAVFVSLVSALNLPGAWRGKAGATPAASEPDVETEEGLALEKRAA